MFSRTTTQLAAAISLWLALFAQNAWSAAELQVGILAFRPQAQAMVEWQPFARYLESALGQKVALTTYTYPELERAVSQGRVDVLLTNPGHYILLKHQHKLSAPIATLINKEMDQALEHFGGVIFTRAERTDIQSLNDLQGKRIASSSTDSLGGYQMQVYEMLEAGLPSPPREQLVLTGMPHDLAVSAVIEGKADVGFVRSGVLEAMAKEGKLDSKAIKAINIQSHGTFPFLTSTQIYPEWPIVVMPNVSRALSRNLVIALLSLSPESEAARTASVSGFTIPSDYTGVENVLRKLHYPPFDTKEDFTLSDVWHKYRGWISTSVLFLTSLAYFGMLILIRNKQIKKSENRLKQAEIASKTGNWELYVNQRTLSASEGALAIYGMSSDKDLIHIYRNIPLPKYRPALDSAFQNLIEHQTPYHIRFKIKAVDTGEIKDIQSSAIYDSDKGVVFGVIQDISEQIKKDKKLRLAANVFTYAKEGIAIAEADGTIIDVNEAFCEFYGYRPNEIAGKKLRTLKSDIHPPEFYKDMWQSLTLNGYWSGEMWNVRKDGTPHPKILTISTIRDDEGAIQNYVALFTDISTIKKQQQQLEHIAHYDALTKLPNRSLLADRLSQALSQSQRRQQRFGVAFIDIDGFKEVNDTHGHEFGDQLLMALASRMKASLRDGDTLARLGGDEFVGVLLDLETSQTIEPIIERLLKAASDPVIVQNIELRVSASIGLSMYPSDAIDGDQLLRYADQAMYLAKTSGKNGYHRFDAHRAQHE